MIVKPRKMPLLLQQELALARRIRPNHPKIPLIQENIKKGYSGYHGENSMDYPLSFLPEKEYLILHDVRLQIDGRFFQMDTVLISLYFILLLDAKNNKGKLTFDPYFHQMIQTVNGEDIAYDDPLIQALRHEEQLAKWMSQHKLPAVPIHSLVVITHPHAIIQIAPEHNHIYKKVIRKNVLPFKIKELAAPYKEPLMTERDRRKICSTILKHLAPFHFSILEKYQISKEEILKGVHCPKCEKLSMNRAYGKWVCPYCHHSDKNAHLPSLTDYALLIGPNITNRDMQDFLQNASAPLCTKLLREMNLEAIGNNKGRIYLLAQSQDIILK